ncbi:hypothetical protein SAMN05421876_11316 [Kaistella jeonii]|nr:hypothetical protein SAMN05421876_11316 [Kaistella jeonii]VEI95580.1 Uncharacterised protein [Kaistella jeonii]
MSKVFRGKVTNIRTNKFYIKKNYLCKNFWARKVRVTH